MCATTSSPSASSGVAKARTPKARVHDGVCGAQLVPPRRCTLLSRWYSYSRWSHCPRMYRRNRVLSRAWASARSSAGTGASAIRRRVDRSTSSRRVASKSSASTNPSPYRSSSSSLSNHAVRRPRCSSTASRSSSRGSQLANRGAVAVRAASAPPVDAPARLTGGHHPRPRRPPGPHEVSQGDEQAGVVGGGRFLAHPPLADDAPLLRTPRGTRRFSPRPRRTPSRPAGRSGLPPRPVRHARPWRGTPCGSAVRRRGGRRRRPATRSSFSCPCFGSSSVVSVHISGVDDYPGDFVIHADDYPSTVGFRIGPRLERGGRWSQRCSEPPETVSGPRRHCQAATGPAAAPWY